jgi:hypothetical protein
LRPSASRECASWSAAAWEGESGVRRQERPDIGVRGGKGRGFQ